METKAVKKGGKRRKRLRRNNGDKIEVKDDPIYDELADKIQHEKNPVKSDLKDKSKLNSLFIIHFQKLN